jgi:hypothetical protein
MIIELPVAIRGNTHVRIEEISEVPGRIISARVLAGTLQDNEFVPDPDIPPTTRFIENGELEDFTTQYAEELADPAPATEQHVRKILRFIWRREVVARGLPTTPTE